jgi:hypothetical protein
MQKKSYPKLNQRGRIGDSDFLVQRIPDPTRSHALLCSLKSVFKKSHAGARRLSIRRVAAISMSVSELCTLYS